VRFNQGFFTVARTCPQCGGQGSVIADPCDSCRGEGRVETQRSIKVKIPPGVDTGTRLRLMGEGEHGRRGGRTGDLFVDLAVRPHQHFHRRGADTMSRVEAGYTQAVLGADIEVETLHGKSPLDIPPGTQHGAEFRLRGEGMPRLDGKGRGDHIAVIDLQVPNPKTLGEEELELLHRLAELEGREVKEERNVLDRVKDLFS
jgi:molecular chaperone DnaJ